MQRPAEHLRSRRRLTVSWPSVARGIQQMPSRTARSSCSRLRALSWLLASGAALLGAWPQGVRADAALEEVVVTAERRSEKAQDIRSEEHTSELQSQSNLVCRLLLEKKKKIR